MHKSRSILLIVLCVLVLVISCVLIIRFFFTPPKSIVYSNIPEEVTCSNYHPGNNRQQATVWLGCYDQQLYYFGAGKNDSDKIKHDDYLCVFRDGELETVAQLAPKNAVITILGIVDRFLYYRVNDTDHYDNQKLYCYDLAENERSLVFSGHLYPSSALYFADDESVYVPLFPQEDKETNFVHVLGVDLLGVEALTEGYSIGGSTYRVLKEHADPVEQILKTDTADSATPEVLHLGPAYRRSVIPYDGGLLVHNEELDSLLYSINENGDLMELFNIPCMASKSAVNIHKTDAYISVVRYEKHGEIGMLRYENDTLEGTYKINLLDGSVKKINDMCFDGIYNFDDKCFYCTDCDGNIYKMEFDGTTSPILLISE